MDKPRLGGSSLFPGFLTIDANGLPRGPGYEELRMHWDPLDREPPVVTVAAALVGAFGKHEVVAEITDRSGAVVGRKVDPRDDAPDPDLQWVSVMAVVFVPTMPGPHVLSLQVDGHQLARHRIEVVPRPQSKRGH